MDLKPENIGRFHTFPIAFGRDGQLVKAGQLKTVKDRLNAGHAKELLVISHGWNNDQAEALALYKELLANLSTAAGSAARSIDVLLVYWPSKRFADSDLIPGGAAGTADRAADAAIDAHLVELIDSFKGDDHMVAVLEQLRILAPKLEDDPTAADDFVRLLRSVFPVDANAEEPVLDDSFHGSDGSALLSALGRRFKPRTEADGGAAGVPDFADLDVTAGGAAIFGNLFTGLKNGAFNLLNLFTYFEMKDRAGRIGKEGLAPAIRELLGQHPSLKLHFCGHSFGARLVTAAVAALQPGTALAQIRSMTLLQAAFSHFAFAKDFQPGRAGVFRSIVEGNRLGGPILITHTANDKAVGLAYPIASRLGNQVASGLGDANDPYGGLGRNGAQKTPEVDEALTSMQQVRDAMLHSGKVYNLEASTSIRHHGDVGNPNVANMLWKAMCAAPH